MLLHLIFKQNLHEEAFSNINIKTIPHFAVEFFQRRKHSFLS